MPTPRGRESVDIAVYVQAIPLLLRHPVIAVGPLLAAVLDALLGGLFHDTSGPFAALGTSQLSIIFMILDTLGMALAIVIADAVWRRGRVSFDAAWEQTRKRAGECVWVALGISLVTYTAIYLGSILGSLIALALGILTFGILIYAVAATAIGGVPGFLSLQASLDIARIRPINTTLLTIMFFVSYLGLGWLLPMILIPVTGSLALIVLAIAKAVAIGYIALLISKRYVDIAFRNL